MAEIPDTIAKLRYGAEARSNAAWERIDDEVFRRVQRELDLADRCCCETGA